MPRVSVITPTFNCANFIGAAIESVLTQTYGDLEMIVVDDGSTDGTAELMERWRGDVRYFSRPKMGVSAARNFAISVAQGEFLAYLDADDIWLPYRLAAGIAVMDAHPECGIVHGDVIVIDDDDHVISEMWHRESGVRPPRGACVSDLVRGNNVQVPTVLERRSCYDATNGFDQRFSRAEDYLHWFQVALKGYEFFYIDEPLAKYRRRTGSASRNQAAMGESLIAMFATLLQEDDLAKMADADALAVVNRRLSLIRHGLPYQYRHEGKTSLALRASLGLVFESPLALNPYLELAKSCFPAHALRRLSRRLRLSGRFRSEETKDAASTAGWTSQGD
jgi:glycosyltransferase involved in cell wall biosynthesis